MFDSYVICIKIIIHVTDEIIYRVFALVHVVEIVAAFQVPAILILFGLERLQELASHVHVGLVAREAASADVVLVHVVARVDARLFADPLVLRIVLRVILDHSPSYSDFLPSGSRVDG